MQASEFAFARSTSHCGSCSGSSRSGRDLDGDGLLTVFDFLTFQNFFDAGDLRADFDRDGVLTFFDYLAFQNGFDLGC